MSLFLSFEVQLTAAFNEYLAGLLHSLFFLFTETSLEK